MSLRDLILGLGHRGRSIEEDPTRVGEDAFSDVADVYDELMATVPYENWVDYVQRILQRWYAHPKDVLDLCCGTGAIGWELQKRGYHVIGADLSERMVGGCYRRTPALAAAVMDATRSALRPGSFDMVVCLYDSLNYITDPDGLQATFEGMYEALRPGGVVVFDMNTLRALRVGLFTQSNTNTAEPLKYIWRSTWDESRRLCKVDMQFVRSGPDEPNSFTETHYERGYETEEVRAMLKKAGLRSLAVYEAYSFREPNRLTDRVYHLACKDPMR